MDTGSKIKQLREKMNLKQQDIAEAIGVTSAMISMYENGKKKPGRDTIIKLASFFNVDANYFMGDEINTLTKQDEKDIAKTLEKVMLSLEDENTSPLAYGGKISDIDKELYSTALKGVLELIKVRNKEKYTPKKYRQ